MSRDSDRSFFCPETSVSVNALFTSEQRPPDHNSEPIQHPTGGPADKRLDQRGDRGNDQQLSDGGSHAIDIRSALSECKRRPPQRAQQKRPLANTALAGSIRENIYRDWLRGVSERSLSATYLITREGIESICREMARTARRAA